MLSAKVKVLFAGKVISALSPLVVAAVAPAGSPGTLPKSLSETSAYATLKDSAGARDTSKVIFP